MVEVIVEHLRECNPDRQFRTIRFAGADYIYIGKKHRFGGWVVILQQNGEVTIQCTQYRHQMLQETHWQLADPGWMDHLARLAKLTI